MSSPEGKAMFLDVMKSLQAEFDAEFDAERTSKYDVSFENTLLWLSFTGRKPNYVALDHVH